jgi:DNA-binding transcriptional ArsR family regulator
MFENAAAADLALGRSTVRQRILAILISETAGRLHLREIQRRAGTSPGTASRELAKLVAAGLIDREQEGAQVYFKASTTPFAAMMRSLLALAPESQTLPRPARVPRARKEPAEPGAHPTSVGSIVTATPAAETPRGDAAGPGVVATTGAALEGPLEDVVASAISQLTAVSTPAPQRPLGTLAPAATAQSAPAEPPIVRPDGPAPDQETWSGIPDPALIEIIRRRAAADPLGLRIARRLADSVESIYGERLRGMYLFGARAAGPVDAADPADVETVIVLDQVDRYGAELERTSHACAALSHEHGLVVSRIFVSEEDWRNREDGSMPMLRAEAVVA